MSTLHNGSEQCFGRHLGMSLVRIVQKKVVESSFEEGLTHKKEMKLSKNWGSGILFPNMAIIGCGLFDLCSQVQCTGTQHMHLMSFYFKLELNHQNN